VTTVRPVFTGHSAVANVVSCKYIKMHVRSSPCVEHALSFPTLRKGGPGGVWAAPSEIKLVYPVLFAFPGGGLKPSRGDRFGWHKARCGPAGVFHAHTKRVFARSQDVEMTCEGGTPTWEGFRAWHKVALDGNFFANSPEFLGAHYNIL
jgi:hypothetical protein